MLRGRLLRCLIARLPLILKEGNQASQDVVGYVVPIWLTEFIVLASEDMLWTYVVVLGKHNSHYSKKREKSHNNWNESCLRWTRTRFYSRLWKFEISFVCSFRNMSPTRVGKDHVWHVHEWSETASGLSRRSSRMTHLLEMCFSVAGNLSAIWAKSSFLINNRGDWTLLRVT